MRKEKRNKNWQWRNGLCLLLSCSLIVLLVPVLSVQAAEDQTDRAPIAVQVFQSLDDDEDVADPLSVKNGDRVHYYTVVTNQGEMINEPITIRNFKGKGLKSSPLSVSEGGILGYNEVTWKLDSLQANETRIFSYDVIVPYLQDGQWNNYAQVEVGGQVYESGKIWLREPGLAPFTVEAYIVKSDNGISYEDMEVHPGEQLRFTLQVTNNASDVAEKISVDSKVGKELIISPENISDGGEFHDGMVSWKIPSIQPGKTVMVHYTAEVPENPTFSRYRSHFEVHTSKYPNPIKASTMRVSVSAEGVKKPQNQNFYTQNQHLINYGMFTLVLLALLGVGLRMWIKKYSGSKPKK